MIRKNIGLAVILSLVAFIGCQKGSTGDTGPQGPQGTTGATLPTVLWVSPAPGDINIALDSVVRAVFSKAMDASTLNASTVQVSVAGVPITGTISYNSGSRTVYFTPGLPLTSFTFYSAVLTTGVKATDGTALARNYSWSFTTGGSFAPSALYVANRLNNSVSVFNNAGAANGNIPPDRQVVGAATTFNRPLGLWLDKGADRLYVTSQSSASILIFNNASTLTGNIAPSRSIQGAATQLSSPYGIWLNSLTDALYVVSWGNNSISEWDGISTVNGNIAPTRTVTGGNTQFNVPTVLRLDAIRNTLYVGNFSGNSVLAFTTASTATGNISPSRAITGASTGMDGVWGLWLDAASDSLYVSNCNADTIVVFSNASSLTGDVAPSRTIGGAATLLICPSGLWLDSSTDRLYVANEGGQNIAVFNSASSAAGNVAPSRNITGANTTLSNPIGIWLDSD